MAETLQNRIKTLMEKHGIKQNELARRIKVTPQAVNGWFQKGARPSHDNLVALAELFNVTIDELTARTSNGPRPENSIIRIDTYSGKPIPFRVLGEISVSRMLHEPNSGTEFTNKIPAPFPSGPRSEAFSMQDESMYPIVPGDVIIIDPDVTYAPGDLIAVHIKSMGIEVFRKFGYDGSDHCTLVPQSAGHRTFKFTHEQWAQDVEVLGTYMGHIHRRNDPKIPHV